MREIIRGDLFYADLEPVRGSEQGGYRPVVVVQNNVGNQHSPTGIVAPVTSRRKKANMPTHVDLFQINGLEKQSVILLEQTRTLDKSRLGNYIGQLPSDLMNNVNQALVISVGLLEAAPNHLMMCLCPACASNFYGTGAYLLRRVDDQPVKDICTYCGQRKGFDYEIVPKYRRGK